MMVAHWIHDDDRYGVGNSELQAREREARLSALGLMAGGIAHELNSPLQTLMVNATMIEAELDGEEPDMAFVAECNQAISDTTQQISRIIQALRTLSRDASRDAMISVAAVDVVATMTDLCASRFRGHGVELRVDTSRADGIEFLARPADTGQILLNLLNNALDAVSGQDHAWVELAAERVGTRVVFRVVDSGPGVPEQIREQVMQPMFTTKPAGKGTGLGLSLAKSLADKQGAELRLVADAAHTTFELCFVTQEDET